MRFLKRYGIWILILVFSIVYSVYSVVRHLRIESYIFDLGYYDQLIWLVSRFKPLFSTPIWAHPWTDHFSPSIFLLVPLYWFGGGAKTLVTFQAVFACLGAYPIYRLSLKKTNHLAFSLVLAFAYLIYYGLQNAVDFDFHAVTLGPTLLAFILWFYEEKKFKFFWLTLAIFVGLQENFFILSAALGLFLIVKYKDFKRGALITVGSLIVVSLLLFVVIPKFFGQNYSYLPEHLKHPNLAFLLQMLYIPSSKIDVVVYSFAAFGGLALLSPVFFILLAEEFLGRFIGTTNSNWWILGFHYNAILAPVMAFAAIEGTAKFLKKKEVVAIILLLVGVFLSQLRVRTDIYKLFNRSFYDLSKTRNAYEVMKMIPPKVSVAATNDLGAQIAHRQILLFVSDCIDQYIGADKKPCYSVKPDYIFINLDPNGASNNIYPQETFKRVEDYMKLELITNEYSLASKQGYIYLLKRN